MVDIAKASVSTVIPLYNHQKYIAECLYSIWQSAGPNDEIIVIDDCSIDQGARIVDALFSQDWFRRRFGRLELIANKVNSGAASSINLGIKLSRGDFIALMNSDDLFSTGRRDAMVKALAGNKHSFSFSSVICVDFASDPAPSRLSAAIQSLQAHIDESPTTSLAFLAGNPAVSTGNLFFARETYEEVGPFRDLLYCHDWDWCLRAIIFGEPVFVPDFYYLYRTHPSNSFKALEDFAELDTSVCMQTFAQHISRGEIRNELLLAAVETGVLRSSLKNLAPIGYEELLKCERGVETPAYDFYAAVRDQVLDQKRRAQNKVSEHKSKFAIEKLIVTTNALILSVPFGFCDDGWLLEYSQFKISRIGGGSLLSLNLFLPEYLQSRDLTVAVGDKYQKFVVKSGENTEVHISLAMIPDECWVCLSFAKATRLSDMDQRVVGARLTGVLVESL